MTAPDAMAFQAQPRCTRVRVPGKVILSGEHAVVYGNKALACAIQRFADANVHRIDLPGIHLSIVDFSIHQHFSLLDLQRLGQETQTRHQCYQNGQVSLSKVVQTPAEFFAAALGASGVTQYLDDKQGLSIELTMDLVPGGGMGSSAALVAAMLAAVSKYLGYPLTDQELIEKTTLSEQWQHGKSSGLDPYVCIMGGLHEYQLGKAQSQNFKALPQSYLITTGRPKSSTGDCVEWVREQNFDLGLWGQFEQTEIRMLNALTIGDQQAAVKAVSSNHRLLQKIGVVPSAISTFIGTLESLGGAAKICGAGSIAGDQGGLLWAVGMDETALASECERSGYTYQTMLPDINGVTYFD